MTTTTSRPAAPDRCSSCKCRIDANLECWDLVDGQRIEPCMIVDGDWLCERCASRHMESDSIPF